MADLDRSPLLSAEDGVSNENSSPGATKANQWVSADGYLKKRNRWGFWQKRYFVLDGMEFRYYSDKQKRKPRPALRVIGAGLSGRFGDFEVETETKDLELRADNLGDAELWVEQIERAEAVEEEKKKALALKQTPLGTAPVKLKQIDGYLEMPSGIRFKPWQDRFFRIQNTSMYYYKDDTKQINDFEGEIPLIDPTAPTKTVIELTDTSNGRGFVVRAGLKEYKFKAPSADAARDWVEALNQRLMAPAQNVKSDAEEKSDVPSPVDMTPKWMQEWDRESEAEHVLRIQQHLDMLFPSREDPEYKKKTLAAVATLLEELDDKARECLPENGMRGGLTVTHRESRPDIFEFIIRFFHIRIIHELSQFISDQSYKNLSVRDLLRFMDLITAYDGKIKEILQGEVGQALLENLPRFDLLDNAENMALRYAKVCEGQINAWVDNVIFETALQGEARVFRRLDGRYQTAGPTDIFNLLDQALQLGKVSGVKRLQSEIVSMCAVALGIYVVDVTNDLVKRKSESLPLACAIANDCWSIIEHVNRLESEHKNDQYIVDFEPVRERCALSADKCLEILSAIVISDLRPTLGQLFTQQHLSSVVDTEDSIAVVCATMDDYLEDFQSLLEIQFVIRVSRMMVRDIVGYYLERLAHAYSFDRRVALSKREVDLVRLDRKRFVECLKARFPKIDIVLIFARELMPLDDVIDMLAAAPALIPQTAIRIVQRDPDFAPFLRQHVINTAKMCVDLSINGSGGNDKMVKEIKALVVTEVQESVPEPQVTTLAEDKYEILDRMAWVRMWPLLKKPGVRRSDERPQDVRSNLKEATKITIVDVPEQVKPMPIQRGGSVHWQQFGEKKPEAVEVSGPPAVVLTPLVSGMLKFKGDPKSAAAEYFCSVRPISETHATDFEFVVYLGKSSANPHVFRVRVSDIARVSYWDDTGAKHFGSDGKVVEDVVPLGMVAGENAVDFAVAKNTSEFVLVSKNGEKVHLTAESGEVAREWVTKIRDSVEDSFEKWDNSFVGRQHESTAAVTTIAAATPTPPAGLNPQEEQLLEVQSLIRRGHLLIEEGDPAQASRLFKKAKEMADSLRSVQLKAKANAGLAASYRDQDSMRLASGTLFEVAAHFFALSGDSSDRFTCISEAVDVYLRQGMKADAVRVMENYDKGLKKAGSAPVFEDRIKQLKSS